jgi:CheY-like chemotaxis protein/nitrogen-specific signal transduction histidine kinase
MALWPPKNLLPSTTGDSGALAVVLAALEATGAAVLVLDARLALVSANPVAEGIFGADDASVRASLQALAHDFGGAPFPTGDSPYERLTRGDAIVGEMLSLRLGEHLRHVRLASLPQRDAARTLHGTLVVVTDVTETIAEGHRAVVREHFGATRGLAVGLAHEINNPMVSLVAHLDFVLQELEGMRRGTRDESDESVLARLPDVLEHLTDSVREAREAADRVRLSVRDLKLLGQTSTTPRATDLVRVLDGARRLASTQVRQRARFFHAYMRLPAVELSESELCQLVVSMLTLGARSIADGLTEQAEVRLEASDEAGRAQVIVRARPTAGLVADSDTADDAEILSPAHCVFAAQELGATLVTRHSGDTLELVLRLPAAKRGAAPAPKANSGPTPVMSGPRRGRVLVIDDEEAVGAVVRRILQRENDVTTVTRADDALVLLLQGARFDVVLCDMMMPEMSGPDFYRALESAHPQLLDSVVFVTGGAFTAKSREFLDQVANSRLEKPFDPQVLASLVRDRITASVSRGAGG